MVIVMSSIGNKDIVIISPCIDERKNIIDVILRINELNTIELLLI